MDNLVGEEVKLETAVFHLDGEAVLVRALKLVDQDYPEVLHFKVGRGVVVEAA
jgi:hypothetical protein